LAKKSVKTIFFFLVSHRPIPTLSSGKKVVDLAIGQVQRAWFLGREDWHRDPASHRLCGRCHNFFFHCSPKELFERYTPPSRKGFQLAECRIG
jgi:hypothetical protein